MFFYLITTKHKLTSIARSCPGLQFSHVQPLAFAATVFHSSLEWDLGNLSLLGCRYSSLVECLLSIFEALDLTRNPRKDNKPTNNSRKQVSDAQRKMKVKNYPCEGNLQYFHSHNAGSCHRFYFP